MRILQSLLHILNFHHDLQFSLYSQILLFRALSYLLAWSRRSKTKLNASSIGILRKVSRLGHWDVTPFCRQLKNYVFIYQSAEFRLKYWNSFLFPINILSLFGVWTRDCRNPSIWRGWQTNVPPCICILNCYLASQSLQDCSPGRLKRSWLTMMLWVSMPHLVNSWKRNKKLPFAHDKRGGGHSGQFFKKNAQPNFFKQKI